MSEKKELVAVCLSWAFLAALIVWDSRKNTKETQRAAKGGENHSGKRLPKSAVVSRFPEIEHPPEAPDTAKQWRQAERQADYAKRTVIVAACALGVSAVGGVFAYAAYHEASIQADAAFEETRAWITVSADQKTGILEWNTPSGIHLSWEIVGNNIGHSPALYVTVFPVVSVGSDTNREATKKSCSSRDGDLFDRNILFMQEETPPQNSGVYLSSNDIEPFYQHALALAQSFNSKYTIDIIRKLPLSFILTVCASYQVVGEMGYRHTGRVYEIGIAAQTPHGPVFVIPGKERDVGRGSMLLRRYFEGDYTD